jgi:hypothetical protein
MQLENLIAQLTSNAQVIRQMLAGITAEQAIWQPDPATWSVMNVIDHLYQEERTDFRARLATSWGLPDPCVPLVKAPYADHDVTAAWQAWENEREQSTTWLRGRVNPDWQSPCKFSWGQLTAADMAASWMAHDVLHMRQLVELRYAWLVNQMQPHDVEYAGEW